MQNVQFLTNLYVFGSITFRETSHLLGISSRARLVVRGETMVDVERRTPLEDLEARSLEEEVGFWERASLANWYTMRRQSLQRRTIRRQHSSSFSLTVSVLLLKIVSHELLKVNKLGIYCTLCYVIFLYFYRDKITKLVDLGLQKLLLHGVLQNHSN